MKTELLRPRTADANAAAWERLLSRRGEPLFIAGWDRVLFMHCEVDADALQGDVPFELDLREGRAYVSVVAFTMRGMRLRFGGRLGQWLCRPIATHEFLNVRTYVHHGGEPGIYFLGEWLSNAISVRIGPLAYGLPYRPATVQYEHRHEEGVLRGVVRTGDGAFSYQANTAPEEFRNCNAGSLDECLLERYTAFTCCKSKRRFFRIWHEPWRQSEIEVSVSDDSLLKRTFPWFLHAELVGANYSPGAKNVRMGWPHAIARGALSAFCGMRQSFNSR